LHLQEPGQHDAYNNNVANNTLTTQLSGRDLASNRTAIISNTKHWVTNGTAGQGYVISGSATPTIVGTLQDKVNYATNQTTSYHNQYLAEGLFQFT
jgi:hypothetical protein